MLVTILFSIVLSLNSCKKEGEKKSAANLADVSVKGGRLSFKDSKALYATLGELTNKSVDYLNSWEDRKNFKSLRRDTTTIHEDLDAFEFPQFYSTIINANGEYLVGDTIVWFHKGFKHLIPKMDEQLLAKIKVNPGLSKIKFITGSTLISQQSFSNESGQTPDRGKTMGVNLGNGAVNAIQKEYLNDFGHKRKIVIEIYNFIDGGGLGYNSSLVLKVKHYYKGSGSYKPAGEIMKKYVTNLSYTKSYNNIFNGAYVEVSGTIPSIGPQIDGNNLEHLITTTISSSTSTYVNVTANFDVRVEAPYHSQGFYNGIITW